MKIAIGLIICFIVAIIWFAPQTKKESPPSNPSREFLLHVGMRRAEVISHIGEPNYTEDFFDSSGKLERAQWGSDRVNMKIVIFFKNGVVQSFSTKGKVN